MAEYTEEELALLTDEERAGLASSDDVEKEGDDDTDGDENEAGDEDQGGDDSSEGDDDGDDDDDDSDGDDEASDDAGDEQADDDDDDADDDDEPAPAPASDRLDPAKVAARLDEIDAEGNALEEKLDNGDISTKEFRAALDKLNADKATLSNALAQQEAQEKALVDAWYKDVNRFLAKNPELNANETRLRSFDAVVHRVTGDAQYANLSNRKQLEKARDIWRDEMGFSEQAKPDDTKDAGKAKAKAKDDGKPAKQKRRSAPPELPPTLHNVPAADVNDADDGKYSYLDALLNAGRNIEYEDALGKLSEAEQQDYLSRA